MSKKKKGTGKKHSMTVWDAMNQFMEEGFEEPFWPHFSLWPKMAEFKRMPRLKTDIKETAKQYKVMIDLPGMDPKNVKIDVTCNMLKLSGKREEEKEEKGEKTFRKERSYGEFYRQFPLPLKVDPNKVKAKAKNGTLTITLPKVKAKKETTKKIKIEVEK